MELPSEVQDHFQAQAQFWEKDYLLKCLSKFWASSKGCKEIES